MISLVLAIVFSSIGWTFLVIGYLLSHYSSGPSLGNAIGAVIPILVSTMCALLGCLFAFLCRIEPRGPKAHQLLIARRMNWLLLLTVSVVWLIVLI